MVTASREAYEKVGGFHPDLVHANDWEMWARLAQHGPVGWVDELWVCIGCGEFRYGPLHCNSRLRRRLSHGCRRLLRML